MDHFTPLRSFYTALSGQNRGTNLAPRSCPDCHTPVCSKYLVAKDYFGLSNYNSQFLHPFTLVESLLLILYSNSFAWRIHHKDPVWLLWSFWNAFPAFFSLKFMLIQILVNLFIKILRGKYANWQRSLFFSVLACLRWIPCKWSCSLFYRIPPSPQLPQVSDANREKHPADILPGSSRFVGWSHNCDKCTENITDEEASWNKAASGHLAFMLKKLTIQGCPIDTTLPKTGTCLSFRTRVFLVAVWLAAWLGREREREAEKSKKRTWESFQGLRCGQVCREISWNCTR